MAFVLAADVWRVHASGSSTAVFVKAQPSLVDLGERGSATGDEVEAKLALTAAEKAVIVQTGGDPEDRQTQVDMMRAKAAAQHIPLPAGWGEPEKKDGDK